MEKALGHVEGLLDEVHVWVNPVLAGGDAEPEDLLWQAGAPGWLLEDGGPALAAARGALADAYGKEAVTVGTGGAIPLVTVLADLLPEADIVLWGAQDDGARIHAGDESVDLAELQRATTAEALLLARLGAAAGGPA